MLGITSIVLSKCLYFIVGSFTLLLPLYTWKRLFHQFQQMREETLFLQRHNCCVTFFQGKGFAGWPPHKDRLGYAMPTHQEVYEPVLYFLRTAKYSLDIAVMILCVRKIIETLCEIAEKGVRVRLIMDYERSDTETIQRLKQSGVNIKLFVNTNPETECLMHHKYAVKDYNGKTGYLVFGSLNWTNSGFTNNYEDLVFTTNSDAVNSFNDNFESMWTYLDNQEKYDVITRAVLREKIKVL